MRSTSDMLALARLELAQRGQEPWADALRAFMREAGPLPELPESDDLREVLSPLSQHQRDALRVLIQTLAPHARRD